MQHLTELYDQAHAECKKHIDLIDEQNSKIIIVLDDNPEWLDIIKKKTKNDQNVVTISDVKEFRAFILENGVSKMYIDINMEPINGIDLAERLNLDQCFGELVFVSSHDPSDKDLKRIDQLGSKFMSKGRLLDKIIYPQGE